MAARPLLPLWLLLVIALLSSCSTKKNTAGSRRWQAFTARYNTYFNGSQAFIEGCKAQETGNKDNYTELLPLFVVGNEPTRSMGKANFDVAITKCEKAIQLHSIKRRPVVGSSKQLSPKEKAFLQRKEFNPFLKQAWLLMGKAQYQKGEFLEAAATFSYITRHYKAEPLVASEARAWMARCYAELDWFYDAEDALGRTLRDTLTPRLKREVEATWADLLLRQGRLEEALPYVEKTVRREHRKTQKARLYFLLGQLNAQLGDRAAAYKAYSKCISQHPAYELAFNARIGQAEVAATGKEATRMLARLRRMARSDNNKTYLDQVYYAMGNISLSQQDTAAAIGYYETGRSKATRSGVEKGVLVLRLGELYWESGRYDKAQTCYSEAIGLLSKERKDYDRIMQRSKVLDELVPYTSAVYLQDSLQALAAMPEAERNAAIDRVIEALKKQEKEARKQQADSAAQARLQEQGGQGADNSAQTPSVTPQQQDKTWYFYNAMLVAQGKQDFRKQWGNRKLEDDWRRSNRTVLQTEENEGYDYDSDEQDDEQDIADDSEADSLSAESDSLASDPHTREYYLAQIPFSDEAKAASDLIIHDGLYNAGVIEKDKLEDFPLAARTLERLVTQYPEAEQLPEALYQLFLLYSRWNKPEQAAVWRDRLASVAPEHTLTKLVTDPDFEYNARYGPQLEDSLYAATYQAFLRHDYASVHGNVAYSAQKYPTGANRPKFLFVDILSRIDTAQTAQLASELRQLVKDYPQSDVSELAGMMVKGLESGRRPAGGGFDVGNLWSRRTANAAAGTELAGAARSLSAERRTPFVLIVAYPDGALDDDKLLFAVARFNFTGFMVRGFDMHFEREEGIIRLVVSGFRSFEDVHSYAGRLLGEGGLADLLAEARILLISEENLALLGTQYSYDDYRAFYEEHFSPIDTTAPAQPFEEAVDEDIEQHYEDEYTPEQLENQKGNDNTDGEDDGEWYSE